MYFLDYSEWHPDCDKELVTNAGVIYVHCKTCSMLAQLEVVSGKLKADESFKLLKEAKAYVGQRMVEGHYKGV